MKTDTTVEAFLREAAHWREEMTHLRALARDSGLTEEVKWGKPCYSYEGSNVLIIQEFKDSCALLFCKGALLKDPKGLLEKSGENTQGARRIRFTAVSEIVKLEPALKAFIREAISVEKSGAKVEFKKSPEPVPAELQTRLAKQPALKTAFAALTPGRQRAYILFFSAAKQSATREARIEKCAPLILAGKGLND